MEHQNYTSNAIVKLCAHQGCDKPSRTKSLCYTHYARFRKHGSSSACREKNYISECITCKKTFKSIGENKMYCSGLCLTRHHRGISIEKIEERDKRRQRNKALSLLLRNIKLAQKIKIKEHKENQKEIDANEAAKKSIKVCISCESRFIKTGSGNKIYCSNDCKKKETKNKESYKRSKRIGKAKRRAIIKSNKVDNVDPFVVFERDGWTCKICKVGTPKYLRGTNHDRSPQLDHIIPLAKGGEHSYLNTQCLCRRCNILKSDKVVG